MVEKDKEMTRVSQSTMEGGALLGRQVRPVEAATNCAARSARLPTELRPSKMDAGVFNAMKVFGGEVESQTLRTSRNSFREKSCGLNRLRKTPGCNETNS